MLFPFRLGEIQNRIVLPTNGHFNDKGGLTYNVGLVVGVAVGVTGLTVSLIMTICFMSKLR